MTRGKYASRAESAKVRETALQQVDRLQRENTHLRGEVAAERDALISERERLQAEVFRLRGQVEAGTSDRYQAAQDEIAELKRQLQEIRPMIGRQFGAMLKTKEVTLAAQGLHRWAEIADIFGMQAGELMDAAGFARNRHARRSTNAKLREMEDLRRQGYLP